MTKFEKLYEKILDIIEWAEYQGHIKEDGANILIDNIREAKDDIKENNQYT